ncbi:MAG: hypothetical protein AAB824_01890 [Patescibacteria group bacterium]
MEKQKLLIVGALIFAVGLGAGYLVSRYAFNAQLSESGAATKNCIGTPSDSELAGVTSCGDQTTQARCGNLAGCTWVGATATRPSPSPSIIIQKTTAPKGTPQL